MASDDGGATFNGDQLSYAGRDASSIPPGLATNYGDKAKRLDLSFNFLWTLKGLDQFTCLEELILDNNSLDDGLEIPELPTLQTLTLNKNKKNLDGLLDGISNNLPSLTYLSLLGNQACPNELSASDSDEEDYQRYRAVKDDERSESKRVGSFMRVVSAKSLKQVASPDSDSTVSPGYTPLPYQTTPEGDHHGTFGKSRYVYYGKHSEGNRFILNQDL